MMNKPKSETINLAQLGILATHIYATEQLLLCLRAMNFHLSYNHGKDAVAQAKKNLKDAVKWHEKLQGLPNSVVKRDPK